MAHSDSDNYQYFQKDAGDFNTMFADPSQMKDPIRKLVKLVWKKSGSEGRFQMALSLMPQPIAGKHILEVGCGHGYCSLSLAKMGAHVIGMDYSPNMLNIARENKSRLGAELTGSCDFCEGDLFGFEVPEKVELVFALGVIDYVEPESVESFVRKLTALSEKWVLIAFPLKFHLFYPIRKFWLHFFKKVHVIHFSRKETLNLCEKGGLKMVRNIKHAGYDLCLMEKR
jgi:2-polyprenyl-3-methyl-5-hydroxy-6-metoxy-1,4-benzoquinol methylase